MTSSCHTDIHPALFNCPPTPRVTVAHSTRRKGAKLWDTSLTHDWKILSVVFCIFMSFLLRLISLAALEKTKCRDIQMENARYVNALSFSFIQWENDKNLLFRPRMKCCCRYLTQCLHLLHSSELACIKAYAGFNRFSLNLSCLILTSSHLESLKWRGKGDRESINACRKSNFSFQRPNKWR